MQRLFARGQDPFTRTSPFARFRREGAAGGEGGTGSTGGSGGGSGSTGGAPGGQASGGGSGAGAGSGGTGSGTADPPAGGGTRQTFTAEDMAAVRAEAAASRVNLKAAKEEVEKLKAATLSEEERKTKALADAQAEVGRLTAESRSSSILARAAMAGATVPQAIVGLVPADAQDVDAAVLALKVQYPSLFTARPGGNADGGGGTGGDGNAPKMGMNEIIRRAAGRG